MKFLLSENKAQINKNKFILAEKFILNESLQISVLDSIQNKLNNYTNEIADKNNYDMQQNIAGIKEAEQKFKAAVNGGSVTELTKLLQIYWNVVSNFFNKIHDDTILNSLNKEANDAKRVVDIIFAAAKTKQDRDSATFDSKKKNIVDAFNKLAMTINKLLNEKVAGLSEDNIKKLNDFTTTITEFNNKLSSMKQPDPADGNIQKLVSNHKYTDRINIELSKLDKQLPNSIIDQESQKITKNTVLEVVPKLENAINAFNTSDSAIAADVKAAVEADQKADELNKKLAGPNKKNKKNKNNYNNGNKATKDWLAELKNAQNAEEREEIWNAYYKDEWGDAAQNVKNLGSLFTDELMEIGFDPNVNIFVRFVQNAIKTKTDIQDKLNTNNYRGVHNAVIRQYIDNNEILNDKHFLIYNGSLYNNNGPDVEKYFFYYKQIKDAIKNNKLKDPIPKRYNDDINALLKDIFCIGGNPVNAVHAKSNTLKSLRDIKNIYAVCFGGSLEETRQQATPNELLNKVKNITNGAAWLVLYLAHQFTGTNAKQNYDKAKANYKETENLKYTDDDNFKITSLLGDSKIPRGDNTKLLELINNIAKDGKLTAVK